MGSMDPNLAKAVEWMVLLRSGEATAGERAAFEAWRASNPSHEAASRQLAHALGPVNQLKARGVPSAAIGKAISRASRRAALRSAFAFAGVGTGVGLLGWHVLQASDLTADQSTGIAQRRQSPLPEGGSLVLDARTAVDISANAPHQQTVTLRRGRVLADTLSTATALVVRTPEGSIQASGARFVAQAFNQQTRVTVLGGRVTAATPSGERLEIATGRQLVLAAAAQPQVASARGTEDLWTQGIVVMNNEPLGDLVAALQGYRPGLLRIDDEAARIKVSGVFSLDDTDSTLRALARTQPVRITERTSYWVTISAA